MQRGQCRYDENATWIWSDFVISGARLSRKMLSQWALIGKRPTQRAHAVLDQLLRWP
jgi:hypothetical protein